MNQSTVGQFARTVPVAGNVACDNAFVAYLGAGATLQRKLGGAASRKVPEIFSGSPLSFDAAEAEYLYLVAWSDRDGLQGILASFTGVRKVHSGDPEWRVLPTGRAPAWGKPPSKKEIRRILASTSDGDWRHPFSGPENRPLSHSPFPRVVESLSPEARWMWHNSGRDKAPHYPEPPYVPFRGFDHGEFLVFRIPCRAFLSPGDHLPRAGRPSAVRARFRSGETGAPLVRAPIGLYTAVKPSGAVLLSLLVTDRTGYVKFDLSARHRSDETASFFLAPLGREELGRERFLVPDSVPVAGALDFVVPADALPLLALSPELTSASVEWPDVVDHELSPGMLTHPRPLLFGDDDCSHLVPVQTASRTYHVHQITRSQDDPFELQCAEGEETASLAVRRGHVLEYQLATEPLGYGLGDLLYSTALAPCESVNLAVIDWRRREVAERREESATRESQLQSVNHERSVHQVVKGALTELRAEQSSALVARLGDLVSGVVGTSIQAGHRRISSRTVQEISDNLTRSATATREHHSVTVVQASQAERETLETRTVTNHNHCHTLTLAYYEVLENFKSRVSYLGRREVLLVPYQISEFDAQRAACNARALAGALLDPTLAECFAALDRVLFCGHGPVHGEDGGSEPEAQQVRMSRLFVHVKIKGNGTRGNLSFLIRVADGQEHRFPLLHPDGRWKNNSSADFDFNLPLTPANSLVEIGIQYEGKTQHSRTIDISRLRVQYTSPEVDGRHQVFDGPAGNIRKGSTWSEPVSPEIPDFADPDADAEETKDPQAKADRCCAQRLLAHLNCHKVYYNRVVWLSEDPEERMLRFDCFRPAPGGESLWDRIENRPVGVIGDAVAFPVAGAELEPDPDIPETTQLLTVPSDGVFAEALLGRCNACETVDETRFWDWSKSPCPSKAPELTVSSGSRVQKLSDLAGTAGGNSIITFPALPAASTLPDVLAALGKSGILGDSSALANLNKLLEALQSGLQEIAKKNVDKKDKPEN